MLGICFGHQILCNALGAEVVNNEAGWEIGSSKVQIIDGQTAVGGGSLPGQMLDTKNLMIPRELCGPGGADKLAQILRTSEVPIITRVSEDNLLLDVRTVLPEQDVDLCKTLSNILN